MSDECNCSCNVYIIGKDTPYKLRFAQMLGGKETGDGNSVVIKSPVKYTIRNIPEKDVNKIEKEKRENEEAGNRSNYFFYVYNVDDRETFNKYEKIHQKLKEKFNENTDKFFLYGISSSLSDLRVHYLELMVYAFRNQSFYFVLQKFDIDGIQKQLRDYTYYNKTFYFAGSEESRYTDLLFAFLLISFNNYVIRNEYFLASKLEEMRPLKEILDKAIEERKETEICFVYNQFDRKTFTAIEEYISKCSDLENYIFLPLYIQQNDLIKDEERIDVTSLEASRFSLKKRIDPYMNITSDRVSIPSKIEKSENKIIIHFKSSTGSFEYYKIDECDFVQSNKYEIEKGFEGARIYIADLSKDLTDLSMTIQGDDYSEIYKYTYLLSRSKDIDWYKVGIDDRNYIIAGDISNVNPDQVYMREEEALRLLVPEKKEHFITFNKDEIENVLMQYAELQEPPKETIHIFGNDMVEYELITYEIVVFINEEQYKFIRFDNHIFKYKVEFHNDVYSFTDDMKHIVCFVDNDDESSINCIQESKNQIDESETNVHIFVRNSLKLNENDQQRLLNCFKRRYASISNNIFSVPKIENDETICQYHDLFTKILKGERTRQIEEKSCCRI